MGRMQVQFHSFLTSAQMDWLGSWCGYLLLPGTEQLLSYAAYRLVTVLYYSISPCNDTILINQNVFFPSVIF